MKDWYLMRKPPVYSSGFESEEFEYYAKDGFKEALNSFLGTDVILYDNQLQNGIEARAIIQNASADSYTSAVNRQILLDIDFGDGIYYVYDKSQDIYWIVNSPVSRNKIYSKVSAWYCKLWLKFISPLSQAVVSYPVYTINSTQYNSGETSNQKFTIGSAQHLIYIPYNEETALIDNGFRFLMDQPTPIPNAYRLTQVDSTSFLYKNISLLQWTVMEDQFSPVRDNKDLMVADYYKEPETGGTKDPDIFW